MASQWALAKAAEHLFGDNLPSGAEVHIERLARLLDDSVTEARKSPGLTFDSLNASSLRLFIEDAVSKEREACAQECEKWASANIEAYPEQALAAECCARRIRERATLGTMGTTRTNSG